MVVVAYRMCFGTMQGPIVENLLAAGLEKDCPFASANAARNAEPQVLTAETVDSVNDADFMAYTGAINTYLQVGSRADSSGATCRGKDLECYRLLPCLTYTEDGGETEPLFYAQEASVLS